MFIRFSRLALLGDLRQYSLDELKGQLKDWNFNSSNHEREIIAKWSTLHTRIAIQYTENGDFVKIIEERWRCFLFPDKIFRRKM